MTQRGPGLEPNLQRTAPPPQRQGHQSVGPDQEPDEYDEAEQGHAPPIQHQQRATPSQRQGQRQRRGAPVDTQKPPGDTSPTTWLERNRSLILVSLGILVLLVILLIWYQFTRQPAPPIQPVRGPGQPKQQGSQTQEKDLEAGEEPQAQSEEPSEAVDEATEQEVVPVKEATKPKPPAVRNSSGQGKKKPAAKAPPKRERVQGDPIRTADDKELNEFASMDVSGNKEGSVKADTAEEVEAS